ncbi:MAG TPA: ABC transporter ATP-binding protein [Terriglobales bacterium]|nr:ABC transporter ATP-binding protein [Terriglobales bacterium]
MAEGFLGLRDVVVRHGDKTVLQIPRLDIARGEVLSLLGPNGAGKTTLLKVIGLLQVPDTGTIQFHGAELEAGSALAARRRMAMVFQEPLLLNATVYQNAALGLKLRGVGDGEIERRLGPWLGRLAIASLAGRAARTLSGGEAQRTSLARALVLEPEILLLDEPFAALDPTSREALLRDFQEIIRENGITTILVTHDRHEAYILAERVGILKDGRLLQIGPRDEVFSRPATESVAEIVGIENRWAGIVEGCQGDISLVQVNRAKIRAAGRAQVSSNVVVCLRSDGVTVTTRDCPAADKNRCHGVIVHCSPGMTHYRLTIKCQGFPLVALIERATCLGLALSKGREVTVIFDPKAVHLICHS